MTSEKLVVHAGFNPPATDDRISGDLWPAPVYAWSATALLMAVSFLSYIDRTILSLLVGPIKQSLQLSDTKIGLLQSAFGMFFTLTTFPMGWLADRTHRMRLIAAGLACWSVMTALCGACINFTQLFLARMGSRNW
jgi:MFS family permease